MLTAAAFLLAYCSGCLLALIRHPIFGLITYVSLIYIHPPTRWWSSIIPSWRWSLFAAAITLLAVLVHRSKGSPKRVTSYGVTRGLILLICWLVLQSFWAMDPIMHRELLVLMIKYTILVWLIIECVDSITHVKYFLWAHAAGCFYLGVIVITEYLGGRFEGFSGPGINEANAAAMQIVTGIIVTFVLFLSGKWFEKIVAIGFMPLTLNALVATISRSGFLALGVAGVVFNWFSPQKITGVVRVFSVVGLVLFLALTNPVYWERIGTILEAGEEIEGVDTGVGRLVLMEAQLEMFSDRPMGCGHRCTAVLSPNYLDDIYLTGREGNRARSSHNTFLTLLVEQGILGAILYILLIVWIARTAFRLREKMRLSADTLSTTYTATVSILAAITVGDLFVDYLKFETRFWFIALLIVIDRLNDMESETTAEGEEEYKRKLGRSRRPSNILSGRKGNIREQGIPFDGFRRIQ